jgi:hypothetical protein
VSQLQDEGRGREVGVKTRGKAQDEVERWQVSRQDRRIKIRRNGKMNQDKRGWMKIKELERRSSDVEVGLDRSKEGMCKRENGIGASPIFSGLLLTGGFIIRVLDGRLYIS